MTSSAYLTDDCCEQGDDIGQLEREANSLWQVQPMVGFKKEVLKESQPYRLQHVASGKYLALDEENGIVCTTLCCFGTWRFPCSAWMTQLLICLPYFAGV